MYDVAYHSLHLEGDVLLGPQVVVLPVQQHHVGEELLPVHVAIARRVQLNGNGRPTSRHVKPRQTNVTSRHARSVNDDHSVRNASSLYSEQLMQDRQTETERDRQRHRERDRQTESERQTETERQTERKRDKEKERERQSERERETNRPTNRDN